MLNIGMRILTTLGPIGYGPMPGTVASMVTLVLIVPLMPFMPAGYLCVVGIIAALSYRSLVVTYSSTQLHTDPSFIVCDELVGMLIAAYGCHTWWAYMSAFLLFRFFDISKWGPVGYSERTVGGALGILLDDIIAGMLSNVCVRMVLWCIIISR